MINTQIGLIIFFAAKDGEALYSQQKQDWETDWGGNKKELRDPENHDGVIIHLKPDILKCEVKGTLGRSITTNKASGGDGIPVELFQILEDDAVKVLNMPANLVNSAVAKGLEKVCFLSNLKERQCQRMLKLHNCTHLTH